MVNEDEQREAVAVEPEPEAKYDLHIEVPEEMRMVLRDSAELAEMLGDIPQASLVNLMNLFIGWGLTILKQKWLARMGYR